MQGPEEADRKIYDTKNYTINHTLASCAIRVYAMYPLHVDVPCPASQQAVPPPSPLVVEYTTPKTTTQDFFYLYIGFPKGALNKTNWYFREIPQVYLVFQ